MHEEARLETWKEIAAYLNRDVATARRWEKREALPVHRHHHAKLGSVYAYREEIDRWLERRRQPVEPSPMIRASRLTWRHAATAAAVVALCLASAATALVWRDFVDRWASSGGPAASSFLAGVDPDNRAAFEAASRKRLTLLLMNVANFDEIMRRYGPDAERVTTRHVAAYTRASSRADDVLFHFSPTGDFVVWLRDADSETTEAIASRILENLRAHALTIGTSEPIRCRSALRRSSPTENFPG